MRHFPLLLSAFALLTAAPVTGWSQASHALDLNTATRDELVAFKGIGQAYADKIIKARPFKMRSELVSRRIMPATEYLKIKAHLLPAAEAAAETPPAPASTEAAVDAAGQLDINRASREQLLAISGIGQAYADKIIQGRPYKERSDLVKRNIMPATVYARIKDVIVAKP